MNKLSFIRLGKYFGTDIITLQQIVDNTGLSTEEVLNLDSIECNTSSMKYKMGLVCTDIVQAKTEGFESVQYWKGVLSNA